MKNLISALTAIFFIFSSLNISVFAQSEISPDKKAQIRPQEVVDLIIFTKNNLSDKTAEEIQKEIVSSLDLTRRYKAEGKISGQEAQNLEKNLNKLLDCATSKEQFDAELNKTVNQFQTLLNSDIQVAAAIIGVVGFVVYVFGVEARQKKAFIVGTGIMAIAAFTEFFAIIN